VFMGTSFAFMLRMMSSKSQVVATSQVKRTHHHTLRYQVEGRPFGRVVLTI
jgi:hypothetical protein